MGEEKKVSRRGYVKYAGAGIVVVAVAGGGAYYATRPGVEPTPTTRPDAVVEGATPKERAINAAKQYIEKNNIAPGTKIKILTGGGSAGHFDKKYLQEFEEATGLESEVAEIPAVGYTFATKIIEEAASKTGYFEIYVPTPTQIPDAYESGVAADLTDWVNKYDPELDHGSCPMMPAYVYSSCSYKGRWTAFMHDYDLILLEYRKDLFEDPQEQDAFESEFGRPLTVPETWKEYEEVSKFFYRPDEPNPVSGEKGMFGAIEYRVPSWARGHWGYRFLSKGKWWWDDNFKPQLDTPEGIEAIEDAIRMNEYMHPNIWSGDWSWSFPFFAGGNAALTPHWLSMAKYCMEPSVSKIHDRLGVALIPGEKQPDGSILRISLMDVGWTCFVNKHSPHPELAYLFLQYHSDPEVSGRWVPDVAGYFEPHRECHFTNQASIDAWGEPALQVAYETVKEYFAPPLVVIRGSEYADILDKNIISAMQELTTPQKALRDTETAWEKITDEVGRDKQIEVWDWLKKSISPKVKKALSIKD